MTDDSCREASLAIDEPLAGTADHVDSWILLEYRGPWGAQAIAENELSAATHDWLRRSLRGCIAAGLRPRVLFLHQPQRERAGITLMIDRSGIARPALLRFELDDYASLEGIDAARCAAEPERYAVHRLQEPQYLVCVNGQRDHCCGAHGAAAYAALRERVGERAWQCTHLGGHRFAPNLLRLPDAVLYGRVGEAETDAFLARTEAGAVPVRWLRGRTAWPPRAQAAEAFLGDHVGPPRFLGEEPIDGERWRIRLALQGETHERIVGMGPPLSVLASCGDAVRKAVRRFEEVER